MQDLPAAAGSERTKSMAKNKPAGHGIVGLLSQRMEQFKLFCQIHQIISLVTLGAPDSLMSGHVLNLLQQHQMKLYHLEVHHHPHVLWLQQGVDLLAYYFVMQLYFKVSILFLVRFLIIRLSGSFLIRSPSATLL